MDKHKIENKNIISDEKENQIVWEIFGKLIEIIEREKTEPDYLAGVLYSTIQEFVGMFVYAVSEQYEEKTRAIEIVSQSGSFFKDAIERAVHKRVFELSTRKRTENDPTL